MRMMIIKAKYFFWLFTVIFAIPVLYFAAGLAGALVPADYVRIDGVRSEKIGLARGPIHFDILLPLSPEARDQFSFTTEQGLAIDHPDAEWLVIGWGAKEFYTTVGAYADVSFAAILSAVSGDEAVMRFDLAGPIGDEGGVFWLDASESQIATLRKIALSTLVRDQNGKPVAYVQPESQPRQLFYNAHGQFHVGNTCNAWVGKTLRAAGFALGAWTPTPQALALSVQWFEQ
jgi:uncharacterized protein (TIGR02117 family)